LFYFGSIQVEDFQSFLLLMALTLSMSHWQHDVEFSTLNCAGDSVLDDASDDVFAAEYESFILDVRVEQFIPSPTSNFILLWLNSS